MAVTSVSSTTASGLARRPDDQGVEHIAAAMPAFRRRWIVSRGSL